MTGDRRKPDLRFVAFGDGSLRIEARGAVARMITEALARNLGRTVNQGVEGGEGAHEEAASGGS